VKNSKRAEMYEMVKLEQKIIQVEN